MQKKNYPLIIGLLIPILMIIFVVISIYIPQFFTKPPEYDFLYNLSETYNNPYTVEKNQITATALPMNTYIPPSATRIYRYSVKTHTSTQLSFSQAQTLHLQNTKESPDGYEVTAGSEPSGMFPFFYSGGNDAARYLKNGIYAQKISVESSGSYYDFSFLGWVIQ